MAEGESDEAVELSDAFALQLFTEPCKPETLQLQVGGYTVHATCWSRENQHTLKATGLMIWECAYTLAALLTANPAVVAGKTILEVGCGCVGICSLIASLHAERVIATDGDEGTMHLLQENMRLNADAFPVDRIVCQRLRWGDSADLDVVMKSDAASQGIDVVIGTDVMYVAEAVPLLFQTAGSLVVNGGRGPVLILCHVTRRVDEADILRSAAAHGFELKGASSSHDSRTENTDPKLEFISNMFQLERDTSWSTSSSALRLLCFVPRVST